MATFSGSIFNKIIDFVKCVKTKIQTALFPAGRSTCPSISASSRNALNKCIFSDADDEDDELRTTITHNEWSPLPSSILNASATDELKADTTPDDIDLDSQTEMVIQEERYHPNERTDVLGLKDRTAMPIAEVASARFSLQPPHRSIGRDLDDGLLECESHDELLLYLERRTKTRNDQYERNLNSLLLKEKERRTKASNDQYERNLNSLLLKEKERQESTVQSRFRQRRLVAIEEDHVLGSVQEQHHKGRPEFCHKCGHQIKVDSHLYHFNRDGKVIRPCLDCSNKLEGWWS